jgi:hypothetical protein
LNALTLIAIACGALIASASLSNIFELSGAKRLERLLFKCGVISALGLALTGLFFFWVWSVARVEFSVTSVLFVLFAVFFSIATAWWQRTKQSKPSDCASSEPVSQATKPAEESKSAEVSKGPVSSGLTKWLAYGAVLAVCCTIFWFVANCVIRPTGDYDAMMDWNLKVRFLYYYDGVIAKALPHEMKWSHCEYPLFVPMVVTVPCVALKSLAPIVPQVVAALFMLPILLFTFVSVSIFKGRAQACLAIILLATTPLFAVLSSAQMADIPMCLFETITVACAVLGEGNAAWRGRLICLSGLSAGLTVFTKREGLFFVVVYFLSLIFMRLKLRQSRKRLFSEMVILVFCMLPGIASLAVQKVLWHEPVRDLLPEVAAYSEKYRDPLYLIKLAEPLWLYVVQLFSFGQWRITPVPMLFLYWLAYRDRSADRRASEPAGDRTGASTGSMRISLMVVMMLGCYLVTFVILGGDPFLVASAAHRLMLQIWPAALIGLFLGSKTPEQIMALGKTSISSGDG